MPVTKSTKQSVEPPVQSLLNLRRSWEPEPFINRTAWEQKKIIASGQGSNLKHVLDVISFMTMLCPSATQVDQPLFNGDGLLTYSLRHDFQEKNNAFVCVFTSQNMSSDYHSIFTFSIVFACDNTTYRCCTL